MKRCLICIEEWKLTITWRTVLLLDKPSVLCDHCLKQFELLMSRFVRSVEEEWRTLVFVVIV
ncbi:hypothetical protein LC087_11390 [Bacillus carboniphilus]|uniref:Uncharacterized protein n=1 Tax=Bacillus carboniphilus TaxID=86663 RepID=A0ABY9JQ15_9BACI|nr:hypothetical protein [Bacillus carboniphilus]WLR41494.1 hypothetical protein LC087_11390 [Bacillus carboniphilus]